MDGARTSFFSRSSIEAFAQTEFVSRTVLGTVTDVESIVYPDADVYTLVTIAVDGDVKGAGQTIVTREPGGEVTLGEVRSDFEARVSADILDAHANDPITYQDIDNPRHSQVGQRVLVFLGGSPADPGGYFTAAEMVQNADGSFGWLQDEAPNPGWGVKFSTKKIMQLAEISPVS